MKRNTSVFVSALTFASILFFGTSNVQAVVAPPAEAIATIDWSTFTLGTTGNLVIDASFPTGPASGPGTLHGDFVLTSNFDGPYDISNASNWNGISADSVGSDSSARSFTEPGLLKSISESFDGSATSESERYFEVEALSGAGTLVATVDITLSASLLSGFEGYAEAGAGLGMEFNQGSLLETFAAVEFDYWTGGGDIGSGPGEELLMTTLVFEMNMVAGDTGTLYALAEAETYASPVPLPASIFLLGSGILALFSVARRGQAS